MYTVNMFVSVYGSIKTKKTVITLSHSLPLRTAFALLHDTVEPFDPLNDIQK